MYSCYYSASELLPLFVSKVKIKTKLYGRVSALVCRTKDCGKPTVLVAIKLS
jgi:hypothetical protein